MVHADCRNVTYAMGGDSATILATSVDDSLSPSSRYLSSRRRKLYQRLVAGDLVETDVPEGDESIQQRDRRRLVPSGKARYWSSFSTATPRPVGATPVDGSVTAVLHEGPVDSSRAAVRAGITSEHRQK